MTNNAAGSRSARETLKMPDEPGRGMLHDKAKISLEASEIRYRRLFESARDGILILDAVTGRITDANPFLVELLGGSRDEFPGKELWEIGVFNEKAANLAAFKELREKGSICYESLPLVSKSGVSREVEFTGNVYLEDGREVIQCNVRDITARKRLETSERRAEERFHVLIEAVKDHAVFMISPQGWVKSWNSGVRRVLGYERSEFLGTPFSTIFTPEDIEAGEPARTLRKAEADGQADSERWQLRKDGTRIWATGTVTPLQDDSRQATGFAVVMHDNTERRMTEERTAHDAAHDHLTGLPNRGLFIDQLRRAIARAKRHDDYSYAVMFLDLDRFKNINDSLGHVVADQLLVEIGRVLEAVLRPEDMVARFGGDEFVILLDDIKGVADAVCVADRIHAELLSPFNIGGNEVFTSTSIGIAPGMHGYDRPEDCLRDADTAMYRAKGLGKARHEIFDRSMHDDAVALLRLETDLRRAVERREFRVHYQPIVSVETGRIAGFEALLRWQHPVRGLLAPGEFIALAEETGLIVPIGQWILAEACSQTHRWQERLGADRPLTISINLSNKQFLQPDLIAWIRRTLLENDCDGHHVKLEITESVLMENSDEAIAMIGELRALGVGIFMDDFGTGYSSLSYLHSFPVDALKIDRSFINHMNARGENMEIVQTIVALAHSLHMQVIAEGVETEAQLSQLKSLDCEYAQGFYFSRAVDARRAGELIGI